MRVEYELFRSAFIKCVVSSRRILQGHHGDVHRLRDGYFVVQDGHHELPVVTEHWTLTRTEAVGFSPAKTNPQTQNTLLRIGVLRSRIVSDVQSGNADRSAGPRRRRVFWVCGLVLAGLNPTA